MPSPRAVLCILVCALICAPIGCDGWRADSDEAYRGARVNRGGGWTSPLFFTRSAYRFGDVPSARNHSLGTRAARRIH